ncbi:hypothetical protein SPBR_02391 [Sporothrix brasiliensis 5110]|uniref:Uncharacterized protein n=1 Tax=Sporothrix brasiliensis 5110 TaxID=1398154 RepID=A0A0C2FQ76_9PEZI|nr:uncharacterized protein SPBR_02391 [Sporothrix brasiliensis 5110]KIH93168.1 hypothetical protein SPBR_02391 [Sporothrix brasiliensis 5110]
MDQDVIQKLQEELARAKAETEQQRQRADEEAAARLAEKRRADEEAAKNNDRVYFEYLQNVETKIAPILTVETDRKQAAAGQAAKVGGKVYPRGLRRWVDFPQQHRQQFDDLATLFGDQRLFPSYNDSVSVARNLSPVKRRDEQDVRPFVRACLEVPAMRVVNAFLQRTTDPRYAGLTFRFGNNAYGTAARQMKLDNASSALSGGSSRDDSSHGRLSSRKRKFDNVSSLAPDRWGLRIRADGPDNDDDDDDNEFSESILPGEYKAVHKVRGHDFRNILGNSDAPPAESLIDDCAQQSGGGDGGSGGGGGGGVDVDPQQHHVPAADANPASKKRRQDEMTIAQVLCQAYHYMIVCGTVYSYVTSGEGTVFLMVAPESADTLLYHCVDHAASAAPITQPENDLVRVPAAQMATLILKALVAGLQPTATTTALLQDLPRWPNPQAKVRSSLDAPGRRPGRSPRGGDDDDDNDDDGDDDDNTMHGDKGDPGGMLLPLAPSSIRGGGGATQPRRHSADTSSRPFDPLEPPRREYCTQACLLGLCRGGPLDPACPNTPEHARGAQQTIGADGQPCHAISTADLCAMLLDQLTRSLSAGVECLMKYGLFGTIGTLFKVTLCTYGYTFVAKGVQDADEQALKDEAALYANPATLPLRGVLMPVYLGYMELEEWPYILPSGACIWHMMLLSWAGVSLAKRVPDSVADVEQAIDDMQCELYRHGIYYCDVHDANLAWNKELGRVMALDFDRAFIMDEEDYAESPPRATAAARIQADAHETNSLALSKLAAVAPDSRKADKRKREDIDQDGVNEKRTRTRTRTGVL